MSRKERYINFIVDDLVKKTEIDYDGKRIKFPFNLYPNDIFHRFHLFPPKTQLIRNHYSYVKERYGARDEEIEIIWGLYIEKIKSLIKK